MGESLLNESLWIYAKSMPIPSDWIPSDQIPTDQIPTDRIPIIESQVIKSPRRYKNELIPTNDEKWKLIVIHCFGIWIQWAEDCVTKDEFEMALS